MTWSAKLFPTPRDEFEAAVNRAISSPPRLDAPSAKQFAAAKRVARALSLTVPGEKLSASMNGHANGLGNDQERSGWANDYISVTVSQVT